jgi:Zn-dependent protease
MFTKREIISVLIVAIILGVCLSSLQSLNKIIFYSLLVLAVIAINIIAKKIRAYYLETEIEHTTWTIQRFGFKPWRKFPRPLQAGLFLPLLFWAITRGAFIWMASLVFDVKGKVYKAARRHGLYKFSEVSEEEIGSIAATGVLANLLFAFIGYLAGWPEFARLNIFYAVFHIIPLSNLDGNKIFFAKFEFWCAIAAITLIALLYAILLK